MANHVLGSVLCSPGCFSVYRAAAIRDVLPIYSSKVDNSFDFLTKDMGMFNKYIYIFFAKYTVRTWLSLDRHANTCQLKDVLIPSWLFYFIWHL